MLAIFIQTIKDRKTHLIIYSLVVLLFIWLYASIYPVIQAKSDLLQQTLKAYPESLMKAFNVDISAYTTFGGFFASEQYSFVWPIIAIFFVVSFGGGMIAGEIEKGTIELLISRPLSRQKIYFSKFLAGALNLIVFTAVSSFGIWPITKAYNFTFGIHNIISIFVLSTFFLLAVYSLTMMLSAIFSDKGKVFFISGGILLAMYVMNVVAALKDNFHDLKYFSFFYYFNPSKAMINNEINHWAYWVFIGLSIIFVIIGSAWFSKRNINN